LQHLSIILAFIAVFGLAVFRMIEPTGTDQAVHSAQSNHVQHRREVSERTLVNQIGNLAQRVGALEIDLAALETTNAQLTSTVRQLAVRDPITTASIQNNRQIGTTNQFRSSSDPVRIGTSALSLTQGGAGLYLAAFTDPAALATAWANLSRSESSYLSGLAPFARSVRPSTGGTLYRLIAGLFANSKDAEA